MPRNANHEQCRCDYGSEILNFYANLDGSGYLEQSKVWKISIHYFLGMKSIYTILYTLSYECGSYFLLICGCGSLKWCKLRSATVLNPLPHGRKTLPTQGRRVYKTASNNDCSGHIRRLPCIVPSPCVSSLCVWVARPKEGPLKDIPPS